MAGPAIRRRTVLGAIAAVPLLANAASPSLVRRNYRRIACEEGFLSPGVLAQNGKTSLPGIPLITVDGPAAHLAKALVDLGDARIAAMDADGIDMQLLMLSSPGVQVFEPELASSLARDANDYVAEACRRHPTRFAALAAVAPQQPDQAAKEAERAITRLDLKGLIINSHTFNEYLDQQKFWPIFEAASALDVPVYIHPREPAAAMRDIMSGPVLGGAAWAYGVEVGTHVLKLIAAGVFDRFPRLRLVVDHMGEAIPFWLPRIDNRYLSMRGSQPAGVAAIKRLPSEYVRENLWVTTSGMNYWPQLAMTREVLGADRVLYATDYPFEVQGGAVRLVEAMPLTDAEKSVLFEQNATRLFRL